MSGLLFDLAKGIANVATPNLFDFSKKGPVDLAYGEQEKSYPKGIGWMDQADALRHLVWMGEMQRRMGSLPAEGMGMFHEVVSGGENAIDSPMDAHNNKVALEYMKKAKTQEDVVRMAHDLVSKAKEVNTPQEFEDVSKLGVPFYVGDFGRNNPDIFKDTTR